MKKSEKAELIVKILDELFPDPSIPLKHQDPYTLLIAVLLSAQCTDERVNKVTPHLFKLASTPQGLVQLSFEQILEVIKPCGLGPTKARSILAFSEKILRRYGGKVPSSFRSLLALPGVGRKTASCVLSQAFHKPAFPVDTHIHRLAKRWGLSSGKSVLQTEKDLKALFPRRLWNKLHLQMIYFGRAYCPAKKHDIQKCPICSLK